MNKQLLALVILGLFGAGRILADQLPQLAPPDTFAPPPGPAPTPFMPGPPLPPPDPAQLPTFILGDCQDAVVPILWFELDYVFFSLSPQPVPTPLLTTGPPASRGILGQPGTGVLIAGDVDYGTFNGGGFSSGGWWNCDRTFGSEGGTFWLEQRARSFGAASDGTTVLARPIINANTNAETSALVAFTGQLAGNLIAESSVRFANSNGNLAYNLYRDERSWVNVLLGYRYIYLWEQILITENQQALTAGSLSFLGNRLPGGSTLTITDRFETNNNLYIAQVGLRGETARGQFRFHGAVKLGLGWSHQRLFGDGRTTNNATGQTVPGGVLVQTTYPYGTSNDHFVVVPELSGKIGYMFTRRLSLWLGYTMLYVSNVARPGLQIDRTINPTTPPSFPTFGPFVGPVRPYVPKNVTGIFANGVSLGLGYQF